MRKHGRTPSRRDKHVTLAAISPPGVARGRFVRGQQSGLAGCKPPPLFMRGASSCSSQGRRQGEPWGASPRPSAPTYLPRPWCPLTPGAAASSGGVQGRCFFGLPPSVLGPEGEGGGVWGGPSGPLAPPPDSRGGAAWRSRPRGPAVGRGGHTFPPPPST